MKIFLIILVSAYQRIISPWIGGRCRFIPSCSDYMKEALNTHGVIAGLRLGLTRISRCHPFGASGLDMVPFRYSDKGMTSHEK